MNYVRPSSHCGGGLSHARGRKRPLRSRGHSPARAFPPLVLSSEPCGAHARGRKRPLRSRGHSPARAFPPLVLSSSLLRAASAPAGRSGTAGSARRRPPFPQAPFGAAARLRPAWRAPRALALAAALAPWGAFRYAVRGRARAALGPFSRSSLRARSMRLYCALRHSAQLRAGRRRCARSRSRFVRPSFALVAPCSLYHGPLLRSAPPRAECGLRPHGGSAPRPRRRYAARLRRPAAGAPTAPSKVLKITNYL